ncbi:MAG TPA: NAD(P)-binding protein [Steroidobacteraceae bacterium]|jgi:spermidine dehydrogenase|nr:NAD(P)-binding protein [Steroidobacteraceae bacterium]
MNRESRTLGLDAPITRRDFVGATLVGSGAILLGAAAPAFAQGLTASWTGYGGVGDYGRSNGNVAAVVNAAHGVRDGRYGAGIDSAPLVDEPYDLIIVGGGFSGLIAAYEFHKARPNGRCLVLDNHPIFGGEAKQNQMLVDGVMLTGPQGSNDAVVPKADNNYSHVVGLWDEIGMPRSYEFVKPAAAPPGLKFARDNYDPMYWNEGMSSLGYYFDVPFASKRAWVVDPWSDDLRRAPISAAARESWVRWKKHSPILTRGDEASTDRWLDSMSYGDLIVRELGLSKDVFRLSDPLVATGDYGVSSDAVSAYGAKLLGLPGTGESIITDDVLSFPGGNAAILRHIVKAMLPGAIRGTRSFSDVLYAPIDFEALDRPQHTRIRLNATVVAVKHDGKPEAGGGVNVTYAVDGKLVRVHGKTAIVAAGGWIARHIVRDLPEPYVNAYAKFHHGPILVANVAVRNWKAFAKLGIAAAHWFDGFGFFVNIRQPMRIEGVPVPLDPSKPAMLTFYVGFPQSGVPIETQTAVGRARLLATTYADFELQIRRQMQQMLGDCGFDARRDIAGVVLNRWGHAYIAPQPGFYFGTPGSPAPLEVVRARHGRIAFGHSELSGRQSWGRAAQESRRALGQVLEVMA